MTKRRVIQIAMSESEEDHTQWALCDDGSVWMYQWPSPIYKDVPATPDRPYSSREKIGENPASWVRMADIPQDEEVKS